MICLLISIFSEHSSCHQMFFGTLEFLLVFFVECKCLLLFVFVCYVTCCFIVVRDSIEKVSRLFHQFHLFVQGFWRSSEGMTKRQFIAHLILYLRTEVLLGGDRLDTHSYESASFRYGLNETISRKTFDWGYTLEYDRFISQGSHTSPKIPLTNSLPES